MIKEGQEKKPGVYKIWHTSAPKYVYIGSTVVHLQRRFGKHLNELNTGIHATPFLVNVFNKYGLDGLMCELLEHSELPAKELRQLEQKYIDAFIVEEGRGFLMNGSITAAMPLDDPEVQRKKVARVKEAYSTPEMLEKAKDSMHKLLSNPEIQKKRKSALAETCARKTKAREDAKQSVITEKHTAWLETPYGKPVICTTTGKRFENAKVAVEVMNLSVPYTKIIQTCLGQFSVCVGKMWEFEDETMRPVREFVQWRTQRPVVNITTGMTFESVNSAVRWLRENGYPKAAKSSVSHSCEYKDRTAFGMVWEYLDGPRSCDKPIAPSQVKLTEVERTESRRVAGLKTQNRMKDPAVASYHVERMNAATRKPVICVETGESFISVSEASKWVRSVTTFKAAPDKISMSCMGRRPSAYGYTWKYLTPT